MTEFKVGDRVRRIKHSGLIASNCPIGYETTVLEILTGSSEPYGIWYKGSDGLRQNSTELGDWELADSPVRTVTRREIVTGLYGVVNVTAVEDGHVIVQFENGSMRGYVFSADELRSAAMILWQLADALEGQK